MRGTILILGTVALIAAACGEQDAAVTATQPSADPDVRYIGTGLVLSSPDHGAQLCLGGVEESYPPQCGGPDVVNWNWDDVDGAETSAGSTWGHYTVVGTYDDQRFTLTEPARLPETPDTAPAAPDFSTPCEEPAGGWAVVDAETATLAAQDAAIAYASAQPDHAGIWVDQSINPAMAEGADLEDLDREMAANDPALLILNVGFTGDLERHERELRAIWGGSLCVSLAEHSEAELERIRAEVEGQTTFLGSGIDGRTGRVELAVIVDDGLQARFDEEYGAGLVVVNPALVPVD